MYIYLELVGQVERSGTDLPLSDSGTHAEGEAGYDDSAQSSCRTSLSVNRIMLTA